MNWKLNRTEIFLHTLYIKRTELRKVLDGFKIHGITTWQLGHESFELNYDSVSLVSLADGVYLMSYNR